MIYWLNNGKINQDKGQFGVIMQTKNESKNLILGADFCAKKGSDFKLLKPIICFSEVCNFNETADKVYPKKRNEEILSCESAKIKDQKYSVWKLLESAVNRFIRADFNKINFKKEQNGKWVCDKFCFSLSHSEDMVVVIISNEEVGIDCQKIKPLKDGIEKLILTKEESQIYSALTKEEKQTFLIKTWCKKECLLKLKGESSLNPTSRETSNLTFFERQISLNGKNYYLCAKGEGIDKNTPIYKIEL